MDKIFKGKISGHEVTFKDKDARIYFDNNWYGRIQKKRLILDLVEAAYFFEKKRINLDKMKLREFFQICSKEIPNFVAKYNVYKDLRERGLVTRKGYEGSDFIVYERGAKPSSPTKIKWIVFSSSEDTSCSLENLGKAIKLSKNIRATALWAVCDNDLSITYYIVSSIKP